MPWSRCAGSSARACPASTVGCARSPLFRAGPRRKPGCAAISAGSSLPDAKSMARHGAAPGGPATRAPTRGSADARNGPRCPPGRRRAPRTTDSRHDIPVAPNLLDRNFAAERPDTVWLADISYLPTGEGWLYLAVIEDMASREIVGWSMADHLRAELCIDALVMALQRCRPEPGLILHSDRGVQYASNPYREVLERHGIRQSMSRRGNCLDNAPMESFFASMKKEHVHQARFRTREEAKAAVFEYVEIFYNRQRLHSALGYCTPVETRLRMEGIAIRAAARRSDLTP